MNLAEWSVRRIGLLWVGMVALYATIAIVEVIRDHRAEREWHAQHPWFSQATDLDSLYLTQAQRDSLRSLLDSTMTAAAQSIAHGMQQASHQFFWFAVGVLSLIALPALVVIGLTIAWAIMRHRAKRHSLPSAA